MTFIKFQKPTNQNKKKIRMKIQDNLKFILATTRQKQKGIRAATGRFTKQEIGSTDPD